MRPLSSFRNPSGVSTPCFSNNSKTRTVDRWRPFRLVVLIFIAATISHRRSISWAGIAREWLTELALALREETYRPEPIRRVFIAKANGKLRPLSISTVRDRVCMTAAMLVLEPIFEADLPPQIYAYRAGRNAQQAAVEVEGLLFRGHPAVVGADLADYFGR